MELLQTRGMDPPRPGGSRTVEENGEARRDGGRRLADFLKRKEALRGMTAGETRRRARARQRRAP